MGTLGDNCIVKESADREGGEEREEESSWGYHDEYNFDFATAGQWQSTASMSLPRHIDPRFACSRTAIISEL